MTISYIVPTLNRPTLSDAVWSIVCEPGDEILAIGPACEAMRPELRHIQTHKNGRDWGAFERHTGMAVAKGDYLAFLDDDDVFLPGHRIAVQVQSTLFPLYDRNPQTFVPNIFLAQPKDYRPATMSVSFGGAAASAVWLPIAR